MNRTTKKLFALLAAIALVAAACESDSAQSKANSDAERLTQQEIDDSAANDRKLSDSDISTAVVTQLLVDTSVGAQGVSVETNEGIVRLTGEVDAIMHKQRAEDVATTIKGVRGVVNMIDVNAPKVADSTLVKNIEIALADDPATDSFEIGVIANSGSVVLTGTVESFAEAQLASRVAKSVRGVSSLTNNIDVSFDEARLDEEIEEEIRQRIAWDTRVDSAGIYIEVADGDVTLTGEVPSLYQKGVVQSLAWVRGVNEVVIEPLDVAWWKRDAMLDRDVLESRSDAAVADAVRDALLYDPRVMSFEVNVLVEEGEVTLVGTVDNLQARRAAAVTAANVNGVWEINNLLEVESDFEEFVDTSITETIERRLVQNGLTESLEIAVTTEDGRVTLAGTVDSVLESHTARDVAATTPGVTDVTNNLKVASPNMAGTDPMADDVVEQRITSELFWSPIVDEGDVRVRVDDGVAELTGTVETMTEREAAIENAYEGGAADVEADNLSVAFGAAYLVPSGIAY